MEKTLLENLQRKRPLIDSIDLTENGPKPSFIDLNTGEYCNRKCVFCPRYDSNIYPNQKLFMSINAIANIKAKPSNALNRRSVKTSCSSDLCNVLCFINIQN